ncbi:MAG TPA: SDR family oxidoreductase [Pseudolabrys sp.]|jgi:NAD(P)-dependent dehydrogenase (short-subunit alcohol dehydrogenase family)|nr:SDR family oxidoreductase [Pseudolabrys sp.]
MADLNAKIILVTGAAGAIGAAVVAAIKRAGGQAIATDLTSKGMDAALDVTAEADWQRVSADVESKHGRLDGLVNAAGIAIVGTIEKTDFAAWRRVLSVNLDGAFLGCKYAFPLLRKQGGSIVNLSSVSGLVGGHNLAAYNASKGGLSLLTKSIALHGARFKPPVRCNAVCPAFLEGPMVDAVAQGTKNPDAVKHKLAADIPLGRLGQPTEVADLCVYLLSDESGFITGADLPIDGGLTAR